jgi:hypothetical protein
VLRGQDGAASEAPAFLQARSPVPAPDAPEEPRRAPRRRKAPASEASAEPAPAAIDVDEG